MSFRTFRFCESALLRSLSPRSSYDVTAAYTHVQRAGSPGRSVKRLPASLLLAAMAALPLAASAAPPSYVVTTATHHTSGSPGNCTNQSSRGAVADASCACGMRWPRRRGSAERRSPSARLSSLPASR